MTEPAKLAKIRIAPPEPPCCVWEISCDAIKFRQVFAASSHAEAVGELVRRGFMRFLKDDCPYQDEPLVLEDDQGRVWEAMPMILPRIRKMRENLRESLSAMTGEPPLAQGAKT